MSGSARRSASRAIPILGAASVILGIPLLLLALGPTAAIAQAVRPDVDSPYGGPVLAVAQSGNTLYVGGDFDHVGPQTGRIVTLSAGTGLLAEDFQFGFLPYASIPDGVGGWFVGGDLGIAGRTYTRTLAHIRADGSLDPLLDPYLDAPIYALALSGSTLYVGGAFKIINSATRIRVAAFDIEADTLKSWDARMGATTSNYVAALAVANGRVYLGGSFHDVGGDVSHVNVAAVDTTSGRVTSWSPIPNGVVLGLAANDSVVYMAGDFYNVSGQTRSALAAVDASLGTPTSWNPGASSTCTAVLLSGSTVYVGGGFNSIGGLDRKAFAAIDAITGEVRAWPSLVDKDSYPPSVAALAVSGSTLYIGGEFTSVGGELRLNIAAIDTATGQLTSWNPGATNRVWTMAAADSLVLVTGVFDRIGGALRHRLAAIDLVSGRTTDWNPDANDVVRALAVSGSTVYAGGSFGRIGGQQHRAIVGLDAASGTPTPAWTAGADGAVRALAVSGPLLYAGGSFTHVGGQPRSRIAALDLATGIPNAWQPDADSTVRALAMGSGTVYVGGDFNQAGGADRMRVAALDSVTGTAVPWEIHAMGAGQNVYALALHGATLYVGGNFAEIGGQPRMNLGALNAATGNAITWNHDFEKSVYGFAAAGADKGVLYVGGGGDYGGKGIAALDATSGAAANWHPAIYGAIFSLITDDTYVYAGGESGLFAIEALGITGTLLSLFQAEMTSNGVVLRWQLGGAVRTSTFRLERAESSPDGPWIAVGCEIENANGLFTATDGAVEPGRIYRYRLIAEFEAGSVTFGPIEVSTGSVAADAFALTRVWPSPATGPVTIEFIVPRAAQVHLSVLDLQGRVISRLIDATLGPGSYQAVWSGNGHQRAAPAGVYFVRSEASGYVMTRRLVLLER